MPKPKIKKLKKAAKAVSKLGKRMIGRQIRPLGATKPKAKATGISPRGQKDIVMEKSAARREKYGPIIATKRLRTQKEINASLRRRSSIGAPARLRTIRQADPKKTVYKLSRRSTYQQKPKAR